MEEKISREMTFQQVMERKPEAAEIMMKYGLHCIGCHISAYETVEEGARAHGISEDNIDNLLSELNKI
ncbi:MAG: disulfide oxidoreductase [Spirochaetes bacterium GWF1_41_5]|nr:MAG: disulfide oxidoreductase [Spirochaetes bacterium GWF1_41_5]HBE03909.1 disulfide oxidoreductase [Spirochaetia bacterium]